MSQDVKPGRPYEGASRQARTRRTRAAVVETARSLFAERGYAATTIEAISDRSDTAGTMLKEQVRGYVLVDARLPAPGHSWMETVQPGFAARLREMGGPQGRLPPWPQWWAEEELAALAPRSCRPAAFH